MTIFDAPALTRNILNTWAFVLLALSIFNMLFLFYQKKKIFNVTFVIPFVLAFFIAQIFSNISATNMGRKMLPLTAILGKLPITYAIIALALISLLLAFQYYLSFKNYAGHITSYSVKNVADKLPIGFCYYYENGRIFLSNQKMEEISFALTGESLSNALTLKTAVDKCEILKLDSGEVYRFSCKKLDNKKGAFYEIIADDVTKIYRKGEELKEKNAQLNERNKQLKDYGKNIDEIVFSEEVLASKKNIHNEMNRLLLSTEKAISSGDSAEKKAVLDKWRRNIILLCMEAQGEKSSVFDDLEKLASIIGIKLSYNAVPRTQDDRVLRLFVQATDEAMSNAVKHAGAKNLYININEDEHALVVKYKNDGEAILCDAKTRDGAIGETTPACKTMLGSEIIEFTGGLKTLAENIEKIGGKLEAYCGDGAKTKALVANADEKAQSEDPDEKWLDMTGYELTATFPLNR